MRVVTSWDVVQARKMLAGFPFTTYYAHLLTPCVAFGRKETWERPPLFTHSLIRALEGEPIVITLRDRLIYSWEPQRWYIIQITVFGVKISLKRREEKGFQHLEVFWYELRTHPKIDGVILDSVVLTMTDNIGWDCEV